MLGVCRVGDYGTGVCNNHNPSQNVTVIIVHGASTVLSNGFATSHINAVGVASCGHTGQVTGSNNTVQAEFQLVSRNSDAGTLGPNGAFGSFTIQRGSQNVFAE